MLLAVVGFSVPVFVVGYVLAFVFALELNWLPVQGYTPISERVLAVPAQPDPADGDLGRRLHRADRPDHPGHHARGAVAGLRPDRARQGGGAGRSVLFVHALKNAAVPIVTVVGLGVALLIGGAVVTESVFAIPGLGRLTVDAILRRDYPVIQGVVLLFSFIYVLVNLVVDLLYTVFDPRIRY